MPLDQLFFFWRSEKVIRVALFVFEMQRKVGVMKKSNIMTLGIYTRYYTTY
jgi:hypothetical protein